MELLSSNNKKFQETEASKKIPYISGNRNLKKDSYISENGTFQSTPKKFLIFSQKKAFLIFPETETSKNFFIFQETELSYISGGNL